MKKGKVDKGFELIYYNLSYRRRFIRTLWLIPWMILVLCWLHWLEDTPMFILVPVAMIFAVVDFIQALHNYKKWKEETEVNETNLANVCQVVSDKNIKGQISKKG